LVDKEDCRSGGYLPGKWLSSPTIFVTFPLDMLLQLLWGKMALFGKEQGLGVLGSMKAWKVVFLLSVLWIGWFLLSQWALPYLGAPSCSTGSCCVVPQGNFHQIIK
jgi:hypothetical protein